MQRTREIALLILILVTISFLIACTLAVLQVRSTVARLENEAVLSLANANKRVSDVSQNLSGLIIQLGLTADQVNQSAQRQSQYWDATARDTSLLIADTRKAMQRIDSELIPQLTLSMQQSSNGVVKVTDEAAWALADLRPRLNRSVDELNRATYGLARLTNDPVLVESAANLNSTLAHADRTMAHVETIAEDSSKAVKQLTKPGSLLWMGVKLTWDTITKAFTAFVK